MKIETKIGIGEIVARDTYNPRGDKLITSHFLKVVGISIESDLSINYHCEYPETGFVRCYKDCEIEGDPDFDQETLYYPGD